MPGTWASASRQEIGYVAKQTAINEEYVAIKRINRWVEEGKSVSEIALLWNQGHTGKCSSGYNKYNAYYDSCEYQNSVLAYYNK